MMGFGQSKDLKYMRIEKEKKPRKIIGYLKSKNQILMKKKEIVWGLEKVKLWIGMKKNKKYGVLTK